VFGPFDVSRIERLAGRARLFGGVSLAVGFLSIVVSVVVLAVVPGIGRAVGVAGIGAGCVPLLSGKYYLDAGRILRVVGLSPNGGVEEVMQAMSLIRNALRLEAAVLVLGAVALLLATHLGWVSA